MSLPTRICLDSVLVGDELGAIKLVQLKGQSNYRSPTNESNEEIDDDDDERECTFEQTADGGYFAQTLRDSYRCSLQNRKVYNSIPRHRIVRILDDCLQQEPSACRAITNIRPIDGVHERHLDTTDKPNNLFLITNKVGQIFVCNTDAIKRQVRDCSDFEIKLKNENNRFHELDEGCFNDDDDADTDADADADGGGANHSNAAPMLSPIFYNMNNDALVCGAQPINQTNILVIYQNGDIQHVNIGQDILRSSLKFKRKAIRMLGLSYNSDARAIHWRIDGSSGICYFDTDANQGCVNENDPLIDIVLKSPTHKFQTGSKKRLDAFKSSQQNLYNQSPSIKSRKCNEQDRLVPAQVISMITTNQCSDQYNKPSGRFLKWNSITSLNLIYKKLALYDLVGSENFERIFNKYNYRVNSYKLNDNRLAIGGQHYALRVYDVQAQKAIYNCKTGSSKNPLACPSKGDPIMIGDIDWIGGNKTTEKSPQMLATCSGVDSIVKVYDLRSSKPVFYIDLTEQTEKKQVPYDNHPRGNVFTQICASSAPYSTAVPSQQIALGSTNGQLNFIDLRFVSRSHRYLGKLSGFCGGSVREIRFVSETFETSKMISCATDRCVRIHKIQTSFTSVISQKLATKVFLGTKPSCIQPVCDKITQSYLASIVSRCGSETHVSTIGSGGGWSLL